MNTVALVRFGEAQKDKLNVIYWETFDGAKHFITLDLEWYNKTKKHPIDAIRKYVSHVSISAYTNIEWLERMYHIPERGVCENASGDPFKPYKEE